MEENEYISSVINQNESQERCLNSMEDLTAISSDSSSDQNFSVKNDNGSFSKYMQMRQFRVEDPFQPKTKKRPSKNTCQSGKSATKNVNSIVDSITNTVNLLENGVINSSIKVNKKKIDSVLSCSQKEKEFISFHTLSQDISSNNDIAQNDIHVSNSVPKFESQWGCDTQLAALADNADAILSLMSCKEMTQTYDSNDSFHEPFTETAGLSTSEKNHATDIENNTNKGDKCLENKNCSKLISKVINVAEMAQKKSDLSGTNDIIVPDDASDLKTNVVKDTLIFKIPKIVAKSPRLREVNVNLDSPTCIQNVIRTVSKFDDLVTKISNTENYSISKESDTNNTKVFVGFSTASNKKINISEDALKNAQHIFQTIDQNDSSIPVADSKFEDCEKSPDVIISVEDINIKAKESESIVKNDHSFQYNIQHVTRLLSGNQNHSCNSHSITDAVQKTVMDSLSKEDVDNKLTISPIAVVNVDEWESFCSSINSQINNETKIHEKINSYGDNLINSPSRPSDEDNCLSPIIVSQVTSKNSGRKSTNEFNIVSKNFEPASKDVTSVAISKHSKKSKYEQVKAARKLFIEELKNITIYERVPTDLCEGTLEDKLSLMSDNNISLSSRTSSHFDGLDSKEQSVEIATSDDTITEKKDIVTNKSSNNLSTNVSTSLCTTLTCNFEDDRSDLNIADTFLNDNTLILESLKNSSNSEKCSTSADDETVADFKSGSSISNFKGFYTASSKEIKTSMKSLNAAKALFQNIDEEKDLNTIFNKEDDIFGSLNESSSKNKLDPVDISENLTKLTKQTSEIELKELFTASNEIIPVTDKVLSASVDFFKNKNIDSPLDAKILSGDIIFPMNSTPKEVFQQSSDSWMPSFKSNDFFEVCFINKDVHPFDSDSILEKSFPLERFDSFNSCNDKDSNLKNCEMDKPKNVFRNTISHDGSQNNPDVIDSNLFVSSFRDDFSPLSNSFCGFTTASNKMISVSNEAMQAAKNIFIDTVKNVDDKDFPYDDIFDVKPSTDNSSNINKNCAQTSDPIKFSDENMTKTRSYIVNDINKAYQPVVVSEKLSDKMDSFRNISGSEWHEDLLQLKQSAENTFHSQKEIKKIDKTIVPKNITDKIDFHNIGPSGDNLTINNNESFTVPACDEVIKVFETSTANAIFKNDKNKKDDKSVDYMNIVLPIAKKEIFPHNDTKKFQAVSNKTPSAFGKAGDAAKGIIKDIVDIPLSTIYKDEYKFPINSSKEEIFTNKFQGFQTASNKMISVSSKAMNAAKRIFEDVDSAENLNQQIKLKNDDTLKINSREEEKNPSKIKFHGFQTASNKPITVSVIAIDAAKSIFKDVENIENIPGNTISTNENKFRGFKTASNKTIAVSNKAMDAVKNIFKEIGSIQRVENDVNLEDSDKFGINLANKEQVDSKCEFQGFQTASNKTIPVSLQAINAAKSIFKDIPDHAGFGNNVSESINRFEGFKTANNKIIPISSKAINAAKSVFEDITSNRVHSQDGDVFGINSIENIDPHTNKFQGFNTASNKPIPVSTKAIDAAKIIFKDINLSENINKEDKLENDGKFGITPELQEVFVTDKFQGLQTANNKSIPIPRNAINAAKNTIIKKNSNVQPIDYPQNDGPSSIKLHSYQTANDRIIGVSSKPFEATKTNFNDIDDVDSMASKTTLKSDIFGSPLKPVELISSNEFAGFFTGNNKKIEVSKKALLAVTNIFDNIDSGNQHGKESNITDVDESVSQGLKACAPFSGFMTASSKKVSVSENAMSKVKGIFDGIDKTVSDIDPMIKSRAQKKKSSDCDLSSAVDNRKIKTSREVCSTTNNYCLQLKDKAAISSLSSLAKKTIKSYDDFTAGVESPVENSEDVKEVVRENFYKKLNSMNEESMDAPVECENKFLLPTLGKRKLNDKNGQVCSALDTEKTAKRQCLTSSFIGLTQEISDCAIAFLADEDATVIMEPSVEQSFSSDLNETKSETCTSPILKFKYKPKKRQSFKVPYRKIGNVEDTTVDFEEMLSQKASTQHDKINIINEETPNLPELLNTVEALNLDEMLGDLYNTKLNRGNNKVLLKDLKRVRLKENLSRIILNLSPENCHDFIFDTHRIDIKLDSTVTKVSVRFLENLFENHSKVDKQLIPKGWILNHIKWIMWKLAVYERSFHCFDNAVLTVSNVLKQLKYRYDRELFKTERPILRKILEKDDVASRRMILCVSRIIKIPFEQVVSEAKNVASGCQFEIELTDGWYSIIATIDKILCNAIVNKKIEIGTKLLVYGAELTNCQDGKSPLEDLSLVRLKIHANGCRRVRHYEKLGAGISRAPPFYPIPAAGPAPILSLAIVKVYPPLHIEKLSSGDTVTRSDKLEQIYSAKMESEVQTRVEKLYSQVEKEISKQSHKKMINPAGAITKANASGEELATMMESAMDPQDFMGSLTNSQNESLRAAMSRRSADMRDQIETRVRTMLEDFGGASTRKVVTVHKARAVVLKPHRSRLKKETMISMLTIWRPDEGISDVVREGAYLDVYGATPTGIRLGELHLSANKRTVFREVPNLNYLEKFPELESFKRKCTFIRDMNQQNFSPVFNELDMIGFVFKIVPSDLEWNAATKTNNQATATSNVQTVYMADEFMNFTAVNFWGGVRKFGYDKVIEVGVFLACSNLQHRPKTSRKRIRHLYATEFSLFSQCPRKAHFVDILKSLEGIVKAKGVTNYIDECCLSLNETFQKQNLNTAVSFQNDSSSSRSNLFSKTDINRLFDQSGPYNKSNISATNFNKMNDTKENMNENSLSGLDFETTFVESTLNSCNNSSDNVSLKLQNNSSLNCHNSYVNFKDKEISNSSGSPSTVEMRISRLKKYGEPPKLSPLVLNVSNCLKKEFVIPKFDLSIEECQEKDSKLKDIKVFSQDDFFDNCSNSKDKESHFKEDFVYSPPLSLE